MFLSKTHPLRSLPLVLVLSLLFGVQPQAAETDLSNSPLSRWCV